ncbi:MAG: 2-dehydro-3-deoxygalactonokinase [Paraburkholderia sp.]|uniref:2-dehydro-3-deoxygalactonokinase n=2 Tax=Burkholderiales TaxID=80840 RepID=UPI0010F81CAE|nr:2-dehydro-3-deoxygalactonokinase [Burkholderia sp. 4M9327F10]
MTQAGSPMPVDTVAAVDNVTNGAGEQHAAGVGVLPQAGAASFDQAALVALDWGTTSLRAYLFDTAGNVLAARESTAGIMNLPRAAADGGFDDAFESVCSAWLARVPGLPVIAAGMVGSAQGWLEAPYVDAPANAEALVAGIVRVQTARGVTLHIVPGVLERGELPNVMRGEETQIFGALGDDPAAADEARPELIGLPGTHAKWVVVRARRIERFHTFMTGEVFAALREHTILGRTMVTPDRLDTDAFLRGVNIARLKGQAGVLATVFSARTLGLTGQLTGQQQPDYLSGLLIGHELAGLGTVLAQHQTGLAGQALRLIGNEALCERYQLALTQFGCAEAKLVRQATERGLWRIATQAGLLAPAAAPALTPASGAARAN